MSHNKKIIDNSTRQTLHKAEKALSSAVTRELRQTSEFKASFDEFVHEIKTPLNAILGYVDMMHHQTYGPLGDDRYNECIGIIKKSGDHILEMCNQFALGPDEKTTILIEEIDVFSMIEGVKKLFKPMANKRNIKLETDIPDDFPALHTDPIRLNQVLINLVSNALKFTPEGGRVDITTRYHTDTGALIFIVQDNGQGMTVTEVEEAFVLYQHSSDPSLHGDDNTGLGLSIVSRLMEEMNGSVALNSVKGAGTIVRLAFPPSVTKPTEARPDDISREHMDQITRQALSEDQDKFPIPRKN